MTLRHAWWFCVLAGCSATPPTGAAPSQLVGGAADSGDPSVVLLLSWEHGSDPKPVCTASVISPTLLLTAAHCVIPYPDPTTLDVAVGPDWNAGHWLSVAGVDHDPAFDPSHLDAGHDLGLIVLTEPTDLAPLPWSRDFDLSSLVSQPVRLVGFGRDSAQDFASAGVKRQLTTTLDDWGSPLVHLGDDAHSGCLGDSGGPAFMNLGGVETIIGVNSFGYADCTNGVFDLRVDLEQSFIDSYLNPTPPPPACDAWHGAHCPMGSTYYCADLSTDAANCGLCGHQCPAGLVCIDGGCSCAAGQTLCTDASGTNFYCVDATSNCGG
jgi:hypothetical protein